MQRAQPPRKGVGWQQVGGGRGGPGLLFQLSVEGGRGAKHAESRIRTFYVQGAFAQGAHISLGARGPGCNLSRTLILHIPLFSSGRGEEGKEGKVRFALRAKPWRAQREGRGLQKPSCREPS